ncbi:hypothetical protein ISF_10050 [Cordyceps fumosorosea ARSEF 2679]|uniref:Rhodopsin domain-containing protein n=1 Tax=Cordyceps fumosorosea (strain ARSEF 2679) TaxID=1081104 RepID=A0A166VQD9_CORFA|nr:hypothetical protein ISF_10050 [Cordyceps fumosorosea ARSEF 2679]OAA33919.1 hypothetical protein ISF_10050 [Cordyceps fumosorosea ARSEF 2679]
MDAAVLLYTILAVVALHGVAGGGIGKHADSISAAEASVAFRAWFICELLYGPLSAVVRTSILLFLLRLRPSRLDRIVLYACLTTIYIFTAVYFFLNLFQCSPPSFFWRQFTEVDLEGSCARPDMVPKAAIAHSAVSAPSDWVTALMAVRLMRRSMLDWRTKMVTMMFLSLGAVAGAAMIVRIPFVQLLEITPDFLHRTVDVAMWSVIEPCIGIVAGSLPFIRMLFGQRRKRLNRRAESGIDLPELPTSGGIHVSTTWEVQSASMNQNCAVGGHTASVTAFLEDGEREGAQI